MFREKVPRMRIPSRSLPRQRPLSRSFTVNLSQSASPPSQEICAQRQTQGRPLPGVRVPGTEFPPGRNPINVPPPGNVGMAPREQQGEAQMCTDAGRGGVLRDDSQPAQPRGG